MNPELPGVLVVDDDHEINELVQAYVELAGFTPRPALGGADALGEIDRDAPALIILDLMLPDVDGLEICRRLHGDPVRRGIPVVVVSGLDHDDCRREAERYGVVEYLTKPFDPEMLMAAVKKWACQRSH